MIPGSRVQASCRTACVWVLPVLLLTAATACAQVPPPKAKTVPVPQAATPSAPHKRQADNSGQVLNTVLTSGMPLGGIGAGYIVLMTDGSIGAAATNNNMAWPYADIRGSFAALYTRTLSRQSAQVLALHPHIAAPPIAATAFSGAFPIAKVDYPDRSLPVLISMRAFSPFVPYDLGTSSMPGAIFVFHIVNVARANIEVSLAFSWENLLGRGGDALNGRFNLTSGNRAQILPPVNGASAVLLDRDPHVTSPAPTSVLQYNALQSGSYAVAAQGGTADATVTTATWDAADSNPAWWQQFATSGTVTATSNAGAIAERPSGVIAVRVHLRARESVDIPVAVAWYTPFQYDSAHHNYGHYYARQFPNAAYVARHLLDNRLALQALTEEWKERLTSSSLPVWFSDLLQNTASSLITHSVLTHDSGKGVVGAQDWKYASLSRSGGGHTTLLGAGDALLWEAVLMDWYPDLALQDLDRLKSECAVSGLVNTTAHDMADGLQTSVNERAKVDLAAQSSYALLVWLYYERTGSKMFLNEFYPSAKHALQALPTGVNTRAGADQPLTAVAFDAGAELASAMDDKPFAIECEQRRYSAAVAAGSAVLTIPGASKVAEMAPLIALLAGLRPAGFVSGPAPVVTSPTDGLSAIAVATELLRSGSTDRAFQSLHTAMADSASVAGPRGFIDMDAVNAPDAALSDAAVWNLLGIIAGVTYSAETGTLTFSATPVPYGERRILPVDAPSMDGWVAYRADEATARYEFTLNRTIAIHSPSATYSPGPTLQLHRIVVPWLSARLPMLTVSVGGIAAQGNVSVLANRKAAFALDGSPALAAGQRVIVTVK